MTTAEPVSLAYVLFKKATEKGWAKEAGEYNALVAAWRGSRSPVVAPHYEDRIGNPVLFDRRVFPELALLEGDAGARPVVRAYQDTGELQLIPVDGAAPPDVDTEADYAALIAALSA